jgi:hypothetical protein
MILSQLHQVFTLTSMPFPKIHINAVLAADTVIHVKLNSLIQTLLMRMFNYELDFQGRESWCPAFRFSFHGTNNRELVICDLYPEREGIFCVRSE